MSIADDILKFAKSKKGTIVKYAPTNTGKCEELVYAALNYANAAQGSVVGQGALRKGDIITFANRTGTATITVYAVDPKNRKKAFVQDYIGSFERGNHIAIVSQTPDKHGKIHVWEQHVGKSKVVTENPINTKSAAAYDKNLTRGSNFNTFKSQLDAIILSEFTKEKGDKANRTKADSDNLKVWYDHPNKYTFVVNVSYKGSGTLKYYRPTAKPKQTP